MLMQSAEVTVTDREQAILQKLIRNAASTPQRLVERCRIVLMSAFGLPNREQARQLCVDHQRVRRWRQRWSASHKRLLEAERESAKEKDLTALILDVLGDEQRPGTPATFTAEQLTQIISVACEPPADSGRPVTHWTPRELADEVIKRGIVESISPRHLDRFLKEGGIRPHKSQYWLTSKDKLDHPEEYHADVGAVCDPYKLATQLHEQGGHTVHVVSVDEKTGIQALERKYPTKPTKPGFDERREFEYIRHGVQCLIASFHVATGKVIESTVGETRTEEDFVAHIERTVDTEPEADWIFVMDQLNTHMSEKLVQFVAERCEIEDDLGIKGKSGILKTMPSRKAFLKNQDHRIRFVYTPKHCSWLNQVEIWFSILARRVLKRASFCSLEDLRQRLLAFIEYFNKVLAKPFKWTYTGRPLQAA